MTLIRVGLGWFFGDKRCLHSIHLIRFKKGSKLKRSTIPSISFFLSPSSCKIYCERMFATYVPHPFRSDRAGVGKGSISIWFGKRFHSFFLVYHLNRIKAGLHDLTRNFEKKKKTVFLRTESHLPRFSLEITYSHFVLGGLPLSSLTTIEGEDRTEVKSSPCLRLL